MKSLLAGTALVGALGLFGATPAQTDHAYVAGGVNVFRGRSGPAVGEYMSNYIACTSTSCAVTVPVGKRDHGRVLKWCGAASRDVIVTPGSFGGYAECKGPSPWYLTVHVAMHNSRDVLTPHAEAVTITVNVTPDDPSP